MKKLTFCATLLTIALSPIVHADDAPLTVQSSERENVFTHAPVFDVSIVSHTDNLVINNIIANRGHCVARANDFIFRDNPNDETAKLNYGESADYRVDKCENLLEITVNTNKGAWTFNFDN